MSIVSVLIFLCLVLSSYEKSTPQDDHYVGAVVEYQVSGNAASNLVNYANLIKEAADQGADIVVFPELTLTSSSTYLTVPIYGALRQYPIPALFPLIFDEFMVGISTAARQNDIYVVINGRERLDCTAPQDSEETCPEAKEYIFNTNVVFDRTGAVINRYRKINLFGEAAHTPALRPELGLFTTDFGVTFGHFICFDLMFQVPAVQVVQKNQVKDIIFPTMWFSELPYLTAVQIQEAYAYALDVNFLGAGANNVRVGSAGSGIYSGKAGALISIMPGLPTTKVLVAKVPKVPGQVTEPYPGPIYDNPADHDSLRLITDLSLPSHISRLLEPGSQEFTLSHRDTTCTFKVTLAQREGTTQSVRYRAFVQDGAMTHARRETGVVACTVVACKTDNVTTCPYRFNHTEVHTVERLEIEMQTQSNTHNDTLDCDNIEYFPVTLRANKFPLSPKDFTFTTKLKQSKCGFKDQNNVSVLQKEILIRNNRERLNFKINGPQNELVSFGIWGRVFTRDIDHNKDVSEEDIQNFNTLLDEILNSDSD